MKEKRWSKICLLLIVFFLITCKQQSFAATVAEVYSENRDYSTVFASMEQAWNYAVATSANSEEPILMILYDDWQSGDDEKCRMGSNMYYTELALKQNGTVNAFRSDGGIYVPKNCNILLDLNNHFITRPLDSAITNGEIFYVDGKLSIISSAKVDNKATYGGVYGANNNGNGGTLVVKSGAVVSLDHVKMRGEVTGNGGIVFCDGGMVSLSNCQFLNAKAKNGAGIYMNSGEMTINNGIFDTCIASENGGGIYMNGGKLMLNNINIRTGIAKKNGGGIFVNNDGCRLNKAVVTECYAEEGGGIYVASNRGINIKGNIQITDNVRTTDHIESNVILANNAYINDTGIELDSNFDIGALDTVHNRTLVKNAVEGKCLRGVYQVSKSYHPDAEMEFLEKETILTGSYSGSVFQQNPGILYLLLGCSFVLVLGCTFLIHRKNRIAFGEDEK